MIQFPVLYKNTILQGSAHAKESSIAICILARNCAKYLPKNLKKFSTLANHFKKAHFFIAENNSVDNTQKIIKIWILKNPKTRHLVHVHNYFTQCKVDTSQHTLSSAFDSSTNPTHMATRIMRIATVRDATLHEVSKQNYNPDYLLMCDADIAHFSISGILHSLGQDKTIDWDAITANGRSFNFCWKNHILPLITNVYHDSFALSPVHKKVIPFNWQKNLQQIFSLLQKGDILFPVNSAFGGMSLYKYKSIRGVSYRKSAEKDNFMFCEHVSFHKTMCDKAVNKESKIYINPSMLLYYNKILKTFLVGLLLLQPIKHMLKNCIKKLITKNES